jgi:hypothetical protein
VTDELGMQADSDWNVGDVVHFSFVPIGFGIHSAYIQTLCDSDRVCCFNAGASANAVFT